MSFDPFLPPLYSTSWGRMLCGVIFISRRSCDRAICYPRSALSRQCLLWLMCTTIWWIYGTWDLFLIILLWCQNYPKISHPCSREDSIVFSLNEEMMAGKHFALWISILYPDNVIVFSRMLVLLVILSFSLRMEQTPQVMFASTRVQYCTDGVLNSSFYYQMPHVLWLLYAVIICTTGENIFE